MHGIARGVGRRNWFTRRGGWGRCGCGTPWGLWRSRPRLGGREHIKRVAIAWSKPAGFDHTILRGCVVYTCAILPSLRRSLLVATAGLFCASCLLIMCMSGSIFRSSSARHPIYLYICIAFSSCDDSCVRVVQGCVVLVCAPGAAGDWQGEWLGDGPRRVLCNQCASPLLRLNARRLSCVSCRSCHSPPPLSIAPVLSR